MYKRIGIAVFVFVMACMLLQAGELAQKTKACTPVKVGVLLYGAGMMDGTEIQEAVLTLLALDKAHAQVIVMAPDALQADVINHSTNQPESGAGRNMLVEAARITHGNICPIEQVKAADLDALILPGGLGFIKSITTYGRDGINFSVNPALAQLLTDMHAQKKPLGFLCITPILAAKLFGVENVVLTLGDNTNMAAQIESLGARHKNATAEEIVVDKKLKIVSSPAYMVGPSIASVSAGITKCVNKVLQFAYHNQKE